MLFIQFLRWAYKTLNGDQRPWQVGLGFALGFAFGLPPFGILTLIGLLIMLFTNCHFGSALFGLALGLATGYIIDPIASYPLGAWLIETGPHGLFTSLAASDGLSLFRLHENATLGGLLIGLMTIPAAFVLVRAFVIKFREPVQRRFGRSKAIKVMSNTFIIRGLRWLLIG